MTKSRVFILLGIVLFLLGGALLAYTETLVGTTVGLAGLGLAAWGWATSRGDDRSPPDRS